MAAQGIVSRELGRVHGQRRTPWVAIVFVAALAVALIALGDLESLADTTVLLLLMVFVCVNVTVLLLRTEPVEHEHWRAPTMLPALGAPACLGLIVRKAFEDAVIFAYAGGLLALGVALWGVSRALAGRPSRSTRPRSWTPSFRAGPPASSPAPRRAPC
jgi:APA family basic amino acid/polyamine antiporter